MLQRAADDAGKVAGRYGRVDKCADAIAGDYATNLREVGGKDRHTGFREVGDAVGQGIVVVEPPVLEERETEVGLPGEGVEKRRLKSSEEGDIVASGGAGTQRIVPVPHPGDEQMAVAQHGHGVNDRLKATTHIHSPLVKEDVLPARQSGRERRTVGGVAVVVHRHIPDHGHLQSVASPVDVGNGLADSGRSHILAVRHRRKEHLLDAFPEAFDAGSVGKFRHLGEELMGIEEERLTPDAGGEESRREGVGVVGIEAVSPGKEHPEEEPYVVFGIEGSRAAEEEPHADSAVLPTDWSRRGQKASDKGHLVPCLVESSARAVDTLVGDQVVGDRHDDAERMEWRRLLLGH